MPYITIDRKLGLQRIETISTNNVGELTYCFQQLMNQYLRDHDLSYQTISEIKAALIGAKDDFQERVVNNYENQKIIENGDVWDKKFIGG